MFKYRNESKKLILRSTTVAAFRNAVSQLTLNYFIFTYLLLCLIKINLHLSNSSFIVAEQFCEWALSEPMILKQRRKTKKDFYNRQSRTMVGKKSARTATLVNCWWWGGIPIEFTTSPFSLQWGSRRLSLNG